MKKSFLSDLGHVSLSQKENGLLNNNFGFENIDNTETKEEYNKFFNRISNRAIIFKKLVKPLSNSVEKKN